MSVGGQQHGGLREHKNRILSFVLPMNCIVFFMLFILFLEVSLAFIIFLRSSAKSAILHTDVHVIGHQMWWFGGYYVTVAIEYDVNHFDLHWHCCQVLNSSGFVTHVSSWGPEVRVNKFQLYILSNRRSIIMQIQFHVLLTTTLIERRFCIGKIAVYEILAICVLLL